MSERYNMVFKLPSKLFVEGSPVLIETGAIQKDNQTNSLLAQIKIQNISPKIIVVCKVSIEAFSISGDVL